MDPTLSAQDYKPFLSDVVKKLIIILGPDIALVRIKKIPEITVSEDGTVTEMTDNSEAIINKFKDVFAELSPQLIPTVIDPTLTRAQHAGISPETIGSIPGIGV